MHRVPFSVVQDRIKSYPIKLLGLLLVVLLAFSCDSDNIGDTYYTFTGETIGEYITNRPDTYSEFTHLLEKSEVMGLMKAYGEYTCFLPDNEAMNDFYQSKGKNSLEDFTKEELKKIAYDHIIMGFLYESADFVDGLLPNVTMSGSYLSMSISTMDGKLIYEINAKSTITTKDIDVHNGIIHRIDKAFIPTESTLVESLANDPKFSLFTQALNETGLIEKLELIRDENYDPGSLIAMDGDINWIGSIIRVPKERRYGFTAFVESNDTYAANNINNLDDLKKFASDVYDKMYPDDANITDVTNEKNSLNRFIAYHLVNKKLPKRLLIEAYDNTGRDYQSTGESHSIKTTDMCEYIEPMCPNTLIEVRTWRLHNEYNLINMIDETGNVIRLTDDFDNDAVNGVYHEIDNILVYSRDVERMLSSKRLRMDAASFFPEFTNNNIRIGHASPNYISQQWFFTGDYFERVKPSKTTTFGYYDPDDRFCDYQGDEVLLEGLYDFEIITPPVPPGTYEIRFGYVPNGNRGVAQLFWDGIPTGIPLNLQLLANDPAIGYVQPGTDSRDPEGFENDKAMRNRGYMKAPACFGTIDPVWFNGGPARNEQGALRRILGIYTFEKATNHTFTVTGVKTGQFMFDYLEFVPLEVIEFEDIY